MPDLERHGHPLRVFVDSEDGARELDLNEKPLADLFSGDQIRRRFSGTFPPIPGLNLSNFIESVLTGFVAIGVDFRECDFKDCVIRDSRFESCQFDNNSFATDLISTTSFAKCTFYSSGVHGCEFRDVVFENCDFTNLLIKSSRFVRCTFVDCKTTNKIFEMSMLDEVRFDGTNIQIDTITSNFGLTQFDVVRGGVRTGRIRNEHRVLPPGDVAQIDVRALTDIERLRIEYFLNPDLTNGSEALDSALDVTRWVRIYRNPGSFIELFQLFAEFVVYLFERDRVPLQTVLMLHHVTSTLTADLAASDSAATRRFAVSFGGAHLILSRIVERFLTLLDGLMEYARLNENSIGLLVEGPLDKSYFRRALGRWLPLKRVRIVTLVPHNSPLDLIAAAVTLEALRALIAMALTTRISFEIFKLEQRVAEALPAAAVEGALPEKRRRRPSTAKKSVFSLEIGRNPKPVKKRGRKGPNYPLRFASLVPGSMMVELKINFGSRVAGQLRRIVKGFLLGKR